MSWSPLSDQKGVKPTVEFGERTRNCSPGQTGKEGPHLERTGASQGFPRAAASVGFSPEARRGSQGASRAVPGKSCLHARCEKFRVIVLESWEGTRASRRVEEGLSRSLSGGWKMKKTPNSVPLGCPPESCMDRHTLPASTRDEALFHCDKPSGLPRGPAKSTASLTSQRHPGKFPQVSSRSREKRGFPAAIRERPRESFFKVS